MPTLTTSGYIWAACLSAGVVIWVIWIAPLLISVLTRSIHGEIPPRLTVIDHITLRISSILMFFVAIIMMIMMYEVIMRYVFARPTLWVEELSRWLGGIIFLVAGLYAMQQRSHIRVVILYDVVSRPVQRIMDLAATLCICGFCWAVAYGYWANAMHKFQAWELYGSAWNPPIPALMKPLICITCVWMSIQAINNLVVDWRRDTALPQPEDT